MGAGLLFGLGARLLVVWQPVNQLVGRVVADDAFYYLSLARNLAAGLGATADGVHATNGFHPLYALLLVPLARFAGENVDLMVHLALSLIAVLNVATAWPLYRLGCLLEGPRLGTVLALLYVLNPWAAVLTLTGVESAVFVFLCAATLAAHVRWRIEPTRWRLWATGVAAGLLIMARSEGGLLLGVLLVDILLVGRPRRRAIWSVLIVATAAGLVCLPWAIWSTVSFGAPFQESRAAISFHTHAGAPDDLTDRAVWQGRQMLWHAPRFVIKSVIFSFPGILLVALLAIRGPRATTGEGRLGSRRRRIAALVALAALATAIYYSVFLLHQQHWYFNAIVLYGTVAFGIGADRWLGSMPAWGQRRFLARALLTGVLAYGIVGSGMWKRYLYPPDRYGQVRKYAVATWIAERTERFEGRRFGASDSGVLAYFCRCSMTNLDGVVNHDIFAHFRAEGLSAATLATYVVADGIELLPLPDTVDLARWSAAGLEIVETIPNTGFTLYRVAARQSD